MSLPRFRLFRPRYWLSGVAVLALGAVVQTQHLDDRATLWWQESRTPLVDRLALSLIHISRPR